MATHGKDQLFESPLNLSDFTSPNFNSELRRLVESSEPDTQMFLSNAECFFDTNTQALDSKMQNAAAQEVASLKERIRVLERSLEVLGARVAVLERYLNSSAASGNVGPTKSCSFIVPRDNWERGFSSWADSVNEALALLADQTSEPEPCGDQLVGGGQWADVLCDEFSPVQTQ